MGMKQFVVVSYDISDDRRRTKVMKALKGFGTHVQYSVFECRLEAKDLDAMRKQLKRLAARQDSIRLYFVSQDDVARIEIIGSGLVVPDRIFIIH
jgi:CRISPR-associated protein Cas2